MSSKGFCIHDKFRRGYLDDSTTPDRSARNAPLTFAVHKAGLQGLEYEQQLVDNAGIVHPAFTGLSMSTDRWHTQLIVPAAQPYSLPRGLLVMGRNPARWWSAQMYDEGVRKVRFLGRSFLHVARPELARDILLDSASCFGRSFIVQRVLEPLMGSGLLTSDGEAWKAQRRLLAPVFRKKALERFIPAIDKHAMECRDQLLARDRQVSAILPHTAKATLDILVATLFGDATLDRKGVMRDIDIFLSQFGRPDMLAILGVPDAVPRPGRQQGLAVAKRLRARCQATIALLRQEGRADAGGLVGRLLLEATDPVTGDSMSEEAIIDNVVTFIGAGHETTAVALAWTLYALAHQPDLAERLAYESRSVLGDRPADASKVDLLDLHRRTIQETMRLYPPAAAISRTVIKEVQIGSFTLAPGDHVTIASMPMHRNPRWWPEPHVFDESRFETEAIASRDRFVYLPFGDGPRVCIGANFALNEAVLILARLTPALRFTPVKGPQPEPTLNITLRPSDGMRLRISRISGKE